MIDFKAKIVTGKEKTKAEYEKTDLAGTKEHRNEKEFEKFSEAEFNMEMVALGEAF